MSTASGQRRLHPKPEPEPVEILAWPLVQWGRYSALAVLGYLVLVGLVGWASGPWLAIATALAVAAAAWRYWLPTSYRLGPEGVTRSLLGWRLRIPWRSIARHEIFPGGVMLYYSADSSPLAALHGVYLEWTDCREPILANLEYYLARQRNSGSSMRRITLDGGSGKVHRRGNSSSGSISSTATHRSASG